MGHTLPIPGPEFYTQRKYEATKIFWDMEGFRSLFLFFLENFLRMHFNKMRRSAKLKTLSPKHSHKNEKGNPRMNDNCAWWKSNASLSLLLIYTGHPDTLLDPKELRWNWSTVYAPPCSSDVPITQIRLDLCGWRAHFISGALRSHHLTHCPSDPTYFVSGDARCLLACYPGYPSIPLK